MKESSKEDSEPFQVRFGIREEDVEDAEDLEELDLRIPETQVQSRFRTDSGVGRKTKGALN